MPFVATWMYLEMIILTEMSDKDTYLWYHLLQYLKKVIQINLFTKQTV